MKFYIIKPGAPAEISFGSQPYAKLYWDNWDDYNYRTQFHLRLVVDGKEERIGHLKIAFSNSISDTLKVNNKHVFYEYNKYIPHQFESLGAGFFSLGESIEYYNKLRDIAKEYRIDILTSLNDLAYDINFFDSICQENTPVLNISLLRGIEKWEVRNQFHRVANGGETLTEYSLEFPYSKHKEPIEFNVIPESLPSSNIHALIGSNGVGKTEFLKSIISSYMNGNTHNLSKVIAISFSPFDLIENITINKNSIEFIGFNKDIEWEKKFVTAVRDCLESRNIRDRWRNMAYFLESDLTFNSLKLNDLLTNNEKYLKNDEKDKDDIFEKNILSFFSKLSSGHKIILLTLTSLVAKTTEKTMILYDEPELFLHPPLLSAFINALSWLMSNRNALAIITTHSPIVLQEIPKSCIWKILREGEECKIVRPNIETFGESLSTLTHDIFSLEIKNSGFYKKIKEFIRDNQNFLEENTIEKSLEHIENKFDYEIGSEGKTLVINELRKIISKV